MADAGAAESEERLREIGLSFIAHRRSPQAVQPGQGALDDPAVAAEALAGIDAFARDARPDVELPQHRPAAGDGVALVGEQLG